MACSLFFNRMHGNLFACSLHPAPCVEQYRMTWRLRLRCVRTAATARPAAPSAAAVPLKLKAQTQKAGKGPEV